MNFTDRVKVAFTGTPESIARWISGEDICLIGTPLYIIGDCGPTLAEKITVCSNQGVNFGKLMNSSTPMINISGLYNRGIEISDEDGDDISLFGTDEEFHVVNLLDLFGESEPVPPAAEKVVEIVLPDVSEITTDDLIKVVLNYDIIHESAKAELTKRLEPIAEKAKILLDAENEKA